MGADEGSATQQTASFSESALPLPELLDASEEILPRELRP